MLELEESSFLHQPRQSRANCHVQKCPAPHCMPPTNFRPCGTWSFWKHECNETNEPLQNKFRGEIKETTLANQSLKNVTNYQLVFCCCYLQAIQGNGDYANPWMQAIHILQVSGHIMVLENSAYPGNSQTYSKQVKEHVNKLLNTMCRCHWPVCHHRCSSQNPHAASFN